MNSIEPLNSRRSWRSRWMNLRFQRDVERRRRLVGDQQLGIAEQAHGNRKSAGACRH